MAILLLSSAGGAPGTTTLALGLALTWPRPVLLADGDPGAHQAVLAGYLAGQTGSGKGLLRVAEAHRDRRALREVVLDQCLPLAEDDEIRRLFLPGFLRPGSALHFAPVWEELAEAFERLDELDIDVIIDAGRIGPLGLPAPLLERAALSALVLRSSLRAVMSARVHLPLLGEGDGPTDGRGRRGLVLVGPGAPYSAAEIGQVLGLPVVVEVADDPTTAAHFSDGRPRHRRFDASPLVRSVRAAATTLAGHLEQSSDLVRSA